jgi:hypothetical protein
VPVAQRGSEVRDVLGQRPAIMHLDRSAADGAEVRRPTRSRSVFLVGKSIEVRRNGSWRGARSLETAQAVACYVA